mgnify:CR=1 FL=1
MSVYDVQIRQMVIGDGPLRVNSTIHVMGILCLKLQIKGVSPILHLHLHYFMQIELTLTE